MGTLVTVVVDTIEEKIIQYVNDNPGCSKSDVVRSLRDENIASRLTTLAHIDKLEIKGMVVSILERPNSQIYKIYVNRGNKLVSVLTELEEFKRAYSILLGKSKEIINNKDYSADAKKLGINESNPDRWTEEDKRRYWEFEATRLKKNITEMGAAQKAIDSIKTLYAQSGSSSTTTNINIEPLKKRKIVAEIKPVLTELENAVKGHGENLLSMIDSPAKLFYIIVDLMFFHSLIKWPEQIKDKEQLAQMYSVVYSKISEIQFVLSEFIKSIKVAALNPIKVITESRKIHTSLGTIISLYYALNLSQEIDMVKDSIIRINQDINELELIDFESTIFEAINNPDKMSEILAEEIWKHEL